MTIHRATDRREFLKRAGAGALAVGLAAPAAALADPSADRPPAADRIAPRPRTPLRILILGGTGFIGPHQVRYAVGRGHRVTIFTRGRRAADLPPGVEHLTGDRHDDLSALEGRQWDVVIDNPTTLPNWVRLSGGLLQDATRQYIFISTLSVYADVSRPGMDETTPVLEYSGEHDPYSLEPQDAGRFYGPLKALSEREAAYWFPGRATIIRPGLIVGPGDPTDRFTYWPARIHRGGEVLAPGTGDDPTQIIDARDLAEWIIRAAENGSVGVFNATGPEQPRPMRDLLDGIRSAIAADARFTWVDAEFLLQQDVRPWSHMPVWVAPRDENAGFMRVSTERARRAGLDFRPLAETARDTLDYYRTLPPERRQQPRAGIPADREEQVLRAWHAHLAG